jgi:hypothetical protein
VCCGPQKLQGEIKEKANTEIDEVLQIKLHPMYTKNKVETKLTEHKVSESKTNNFCNKGERAENLANIAINTGA